MKMTFNFIAVCAVLAMLSATNLVSAQHCNSCGVTPSFSYPATTHFSGRHGHHNGQLSQKLQHAQALNAKAAARNDAWPLPFGCIDKRDYANIWTTMLNAGYETQCVLDANFFSDSNQLNRVGIARVAGIMTDLPSQERTVFVHRTNDEHQNETRLAAVRNTIETYYGHLGAANVQLSDRVPSSASGLAVQAAATLRQQNTPPPVIPVGAGDAIADSIGGN